MLLLTSSPFGTRAGDLCDLRTHSSLRETSLKTRANRANPNSWSSFTHSASSSSHDEGILSIHFVVVTGRPQLNLPFDAIEPQRLRAAHRGHRLHVVQRVPRGGFDANISILLSWGFVHALEQATATR